MAKNPLSLKPAPKAPSREVLEKIITRAQAHAMSMIHIANHRDDVEKGDPKVGGHPTATSSALHILSCLHQVVKMPQDFIACKPHASPADHANNYLLRNFYEKDGQRMSDERAVVAMLGLRKFSKEDPTFQSYHSAFDPDHWHHLPSGSVGIPPVNSVYLAHAFRMAEAHNYDVPQDAHFWSLMGDAEYREGSLAEVLPEVAERGLGNVTWILDYNRQSLDGNRILNEELVGSKDNDRAAKAAEANGWEIIQLRHGRFREKVFADAGDAGEALQSVIENALPDHELQALFVKGDSKVTVEALSKYDKAASKALGKLSDTDVKRFLMDLGGHDTDVIIEALEASKKDSEKPVFIVSHSIKGWGLPSAAKSANHSALLSEEELIELRSSYDLKDKDYTKFEHFDEKSDEGKYLKERGDWVWNGMQAIKDLKKKNLDGFKKEVTEVQSQTNFPGDSGINLKMVPLAHTQWMLGQVMAKMTRIAETPLDEKKLSEGQKALSDEDKKFKPLAERLFSLSPDVFTSTNLNAAVDGRIFGNEPEDFEADYGVKDSKSPDIIPHSSAKSRFVRFDITEGNAISAMGSYGKLGDYTGVPFMPVLTVYDFFLKRALDQLFYNLYWKSSFICVGTPSGVTLSPEGAQHGWKSDIQIANMITWEPAFAIELDWVFAESLRRHMITYTEGPEAPGSNAGREGVVVRGVTRALEQKEFLKRLKKHKRFEGQDEAAIMEATRKDCLEGAYYLIDYRGYDHYRPSENVVNIFTMGSLVTEALAASDKLLADGIYANVVQVSCSDLLLGNLAENNNYAHLRRGLGITGDLYLSQQSAISAMPSYPPASFGPRPGELAGGTAGSAQLLTLGGRRIPVVSVHDGEPGLLDNIGSTLGTLQKSLAVRKHSKSGRPSDIYKYHGIDRDSVYKAAKGILEESAFTPVQIDPSVLSGFGQSQSSSADSFAPIVQNGSGSKKERWF